MENNHDLTTGSVPRTLVIFTLPFLLSCLLQALYGAVDLYVVGQYCTSSAVSAVSVGSQMLHLITLVVVGLAAGGTVHIGMHIGMRDPAGAARGVGNTTVVFIVMAVVVTPLILAFVPELVALVEAPPEAIAETEDYLWICTLGTPFIIAYNVISAVFRGVGDSRTPMYFVAVACVVNIALDFILVGGLGMGVEGAALATVIAQGASAVSGLVYLYRKGLGFPIRPADFRPRKKDVLFVVKVGAPIALQEGLIQVAFIIVTAIVNVRGLTDSAAVGVVEKIISLVFLVPSAFLASITAMTAQNMGAGLPERAVGATKYGIAITAGFGALVFIFCQITPETLTGIISREADVVAAGADYLRTYTLDCILAAVAFCLNGYLCGCGKSMLVFIASLMGCVVARVPGAYLLSIAYPDTLLPMGLASGGGSLLAALICGGYLLWGHWRKKRAEQLN